MYQHTTSPLMRYRTEISVVTCENASARNASRVESRPSGIEERLMVQEIASLDPDAQPQRRNTPGKALVRVHIPLQPEAHAARENLLAKQALLKIELKGQGTVELLRHSETYTFNYPKLIFHEPLSKECPVSLRGRSSAQYTETWTSNVGKIEISCPATGLTCVLALATDGGAKGIVKRLAGAGTVNECSLRGNWNDRIDVTDASKELQGVLFADSDITPGVSQTIDLSHIKGRRLHRLWTALHDTLIYVDPEKSRSKVGDRLCKALGTWMQGLMPDSVVTTAALPIAGASSDDASDDDVAAESDRRPVPPCIKDAHGKGGVMHYHLEYVLKAMDRNDLHLATNDIPKTAADSLLEYWRLRRAEEQKT